jgi:hypothetical protein
MSAFVHFHYNNQIIKSLQLADLQQNTSEGIEFVYFFFYIQQTKNIIVFIKIV